MNVSEDKQYLLRKNKKAVSLIFFSLALIFFVLSSAGCNKSKINIREWLDTEDGKDYVAELKKSVPDENVPEFNYFAAADNVVIAEYVCKQGMTMDSEKINSIADTVKSGYQKSIQEFMDSYDMEEFSVVIRYKSSDGKIMGERIITRSN